MYQHKPHPVRIPSASAALIKETAQVHCRASQQPLARGQLEAAKGC